MKPALRPKEKVIIQTLYSRGIPMTAHDIAKTAGMSWTATDKYLNLLQKKGVVNATIHGKRRYWELVAELY